MGKQCHEKKKYLTEETAQSVLEDLQEKAKKDKRIAHVKNIYKCPTCGFWHLTCQAISRAERERRRERK